MKPTAAPQTFMFTDDGSIPNNPTLPFLVYRGGVDLVGTPDPEIAIEKTFAKSGWGEMWRNGIYPYAHFHSMTHGGSTGQEIDLSSGDVVILPAGTGHQLVSKSQDLMVIGAYPKTGRYDLCRGTKSEYAKAVETIAQVPIPETDPVHGADGPLVKLWVKQA
jgi:uncharacterized protein YjlB